MKKLYSIGELINENIKLKKELEKREKEHLKAILNILYLLRPYILAGCVIDVDKLIKGYENELT